jgi:hypothetical protein
MGFFRCTLILLSTLVIISCTCCREENEDCHHSIVFINNSNSSVYVTASGNYPDSLSFRTGPNPKLDASTTKVSSNSKSSNPLWSRSCIESEFGTSLIPNGKLMVYVFNAEALDSLPNNTLLPDSLILKRYDLSLDDLKSNNWSIIFP